MANFNTNQTRHFYVAGTDKTGSTISSNLDIQVKQAATGEIYFIYKNADGMITRSDTIPAKNVVSLKKTKAAAMDLPLKMHTIAVDTSAVTLANLVGKTLELIITFSGVYDYDANNTVSCTAVVVGDSTNTANATAFHKALAYAIAQALPQSVAGYPLLKVFSNGTEVLKSTALSDITGAAGGVVLVEAEQKYVRGKLSGEPVPFSVSFKYAPDSYQVIQWGTDTIADSNVSGNTKVNGTHTVADLEYFALGERGDYYRGSEWPNNYEPTYAVDLSRRYDVMSIEYFWAGGAENVQKSPRMIQVAGATSGSGSGEASGAIATLYSAVEGFISGTSSGSGSGA